MVRCADTERGTKDYSLVAVNKQTDTWGGQKLTLFRCVPGWTGVTAANDLLSSLCANTEIKISRPKNTNTWVGSERNKTLGRTTLETNLPHTWFQIRSPNESCRS